LVAFIHLEGDIMSQRVRIVSQSDASSSIFAYLISFLRRLRKIGTKLSPQFSQFRSKEETRSVSIMCSSGGTSGAAGPFDSAQGAKQ
jgi:hypothetical protein